MSPQKYLNTVYRYVVIAIIGLALIGVIFAFLPKVAQYQEYQTTKSALEADIRTNEETIKELRLNQERFGSDKYFVQQIAHERGFAHADETIYQFNEKSVSNASAAINGENEQ